MPVFSVPHWLDILIIVLLAFNLFRGFRLGLVKMVFGLAGLIAATSVAMKYVEGLALYLKAYVELIPDWLVSGFSYFLIWIITYLLIYQIGKLLSRVLHFTPAGLLDTLGGIILGAAKGLIIVIIILVPVISMPFIKNTFSANLQGSVFLQWSEPVISWGQFMLEEYWPKSLHTQNADWQKLIKSPRQESSK